MGKKGKSHDKGKKSPKSDRSIENINPQDMDDEIDTFHKQRDFVPLDINADAENSDEDDEQPVLDLKGISEDEEDEDDDEDVQNTGLAAKIARQSKFLQSKFGGVEDEMHDEEEEEEEANLISHHKYDGDNKDFELLSSDNESLAEEEREVIRLQSERAKMLSPEDFGIETINEDEGDKELTLEEIAIKGKSSMKSQETPDGFEAIKKDINTLSKEEQMDVVYSSAPELVGLLSELNDTVEELNGKVNPILAKVKDGKLKMLPGGMRYLEIKQQILLTYCQSITFYLLLKSEGQPVRDHPVIGRLVEIKELLDKVKKLDENCRFEYDDYLMENYAEDTEKSGQENTSLALDTDTISLGPSSDMKKDAEAKDKLESENVDAVDDNKKKGSKRKHESDIVGLQSIKMLKTRAALEEKLKQTGVFSSVSKKVDEAQKHLKQVDGQLGTPDDFDDDTMEIDKHSSSKHSVKISQLGKANKPKFVSGDDDLPRRDNIGERRKKHELRVLAGAGIVEDNAGDDVDTVGSDGDTDMENSESEDEFYKQVKEQREAKRAAKAQIYTRTPTIPSLPETIDGKRHITTQIEKNKGLTRPRNKKLKNPRKKYRVKHDKQEQRRKGQVREVRKPTGPYGGEHTGINAAVSRSVRFKN